MRTLSHLERAGLLQTSSRYNRDPGDRTKWFTIDFEALDALCGRDVAAEADEAPRESQSDDLSRSRGHK